MGCGLNPGSNRYSSVALNYAKGAGNPVSILKPPCTINGIQQSLSSCPPHFGTYYYVDSHSRWQRVTVVIPSSAISRLKHPSVYLYKLLLWLCFFSSQTRFLWEERYSTLSSSWAIDNVYIGPPCPSLCGGHG